MPTFTDILLVRRRLAGLGTVEDLSDVDRLFFLPPL
jgi:hypothetical protein